MARPRLRPGDRLWTYQQVAELVGCSKETVKGRVYRMGLSVYRRPQSNQRYLMQRDVELLLAAWLIPTRHKGLSKHAETTQAQA